MNLAGGLPFGFKIDEESKRKAPIKKFATAQCPHCKSPQQGVQVLTVDYKAQNLDCVKCKKSFCSFCNGGKHWFGQCSEALDAKREAQTIRS